MAWKRIRKNEKANEKIMAIEKTIRIKIDSRKAESRVGSLDRKMKGLGESADNTDKSFGKLKGTVIAVAAALQIGQIAAYSDAWKGVNNSLATSITSTQSLFKAQSDVVRIAQEARSPLEQVAKLYGGISAASTDLGASQNDIAKFTELASKAITVQGSSTAEAAGSLLQLRQAIGGSVIQAQEFNSLIDGARPLLEAVSKGSDRFKGSVNKLREEVRKGTVTSKEFFEAALKGADIIDKRFAKATVTLASSLTLARNNAIKFVGTNEDISRTMTFAGDAVVALSENLDLLVIAAATTASIYGARLLSGLVAATAAKISSTSASIALVRTEHANAASALTAAKAEQALAASTFNASGGIVKSKIARDRLTVANNTLAASTLRATAANKAYAASATIAGRASGALRGGLALLGGPVGVAILAATAITAFATSSDDADDEIRSLTKSIDDQIASLKNLGKTQKEIAVKAYNEAAQAAEEVSIELIKQSKALDDMGGGLAKTTVKYSMTARAVVDLTEKYKDLAAVEAQRKRLVDAFVDAEDAEPQTTTGTTPDQDFENLQIEANNAEFARRFEKIQTLKEFDLLEIENKRIFEEEKLNIEREAAEERASLNQISADIIRDVNQRSVSDTIGFFEQFGKKSKFLAKGLLLLRAGEGISSAIINSQVAATRALAELGPIAGPPVAAKMIAYGQVSAGIIGANAVLKLGGGGSGGGGSISIGGVSDQQSQPQRQDPVQSREVIEFRGLEGIAEAIRDRDPEEPLPAEYTQRIMAAIELNERLGG